MTKTDPGLHPLRSYLDDRGETLREFGARAGISITHLSNIINGTRQPSWKVLRKIVDATKRKSLRAAIIEFHASR